MVQSNTTIALLDELVALGLTDELFRLLHHFRKETIARHRAYCEKIAEFRPDSTNERVQRRLRIILDGLKSDPMKSFLELIKAACAAIPFKT